MASRGIVLLLAAGCGGSRAAPAHVEPLVDAAADSSPEAAARTPAPTVTVTEGEGTCVTDDECVVGEASFKCNARDCNHRARSRSREATWEKELVQRCGRDLADRYPCVAPPIVQASDRASCVRGRCVLETTTGAEM